VREPTYFEVHVVLLAYKQSVRAVPGTPIQIEQRWEKLGLLELSAGTRDTLLAHLFCRVLQRSHGLRFLLAGICGDVCSKNSSLFSGYFGQGVPEELHMIVVQCGDRSGYSRWDDVGGVQAAPQANLKDNDIELLFDEYSQSEECKKSAECWAKSRKFNFYLFVQKRYNEDCTDNIVVPVHRGDYSEPAKLAHPYFRGFWGRRA
jgi:hypothetical protein